MVRAARHARHASHLLSSLAASAWPCVMREETALRSSRLRRSSSSSCCRSAAAALSALRADARGRAYVRETPHPPHLVTRGPQPGRQNADIVSQAPRPTVAVAPLDGRLPSAGRGSTAPSGINISSASPEPPPHPPRESLRRSARAQRPERRRLLLLASLRQEQPLSAPLTSSSMRGNRRARPAASRS